VCLFCVLDEAQYKRINGNIALWKETNKELKPLLSGYLFFSRLSNNAGRKTRLVTVANINVNEVSQPNALVPPNPLKQKITNPAINTIDVYKMLIPVL